MRFLKRSVVIRLFALHFGKSRIWIHCHMSKHPLRIERWWKPRTQRHGGLWLAVVNGICFKINPFSPTLHALSWTKHLHTPTMGVEMGWRFLNIAWSETRVRQPNIPWLIIIFRCSYLRESLTSTVPIQLKKGHKVLKNFEDSADIAGEKKKTSISPIFQTSSWLCFLRKPDQYCLLIGATWICRPPPSFMKCQYVPAMPCLWVRAKSFRYCVYMRIRFSTENHQHLQVAGSFTRTRPNKTNCLDPDHPPSISQDFLVTWWFLPGSPSVSSVTWLSGQPIIYRWWFSH